MHDVRNNDLALEQTDYKYNVSKVIMATEEPVNTIDKRK